MVASTWTATMPAGSLVSGTPLDGDTSADVTVIGAGYTGLWTAYHLARLDPTLRVHVVEAQTVGGGASGRNGGWLSGLLPIGLDELARRHGRYGATSWQRAMYDNVNEVLAVLDRERIEAGVAHGGTLVIARNDAQEARLREELATARRYGFDDGDLRRLDAAELVDACRMEGARTALWSPHCAALHPLRLVHGVANAASRRGVAISTRTTVTAIEPERVVTDRGVIRSEVVVVATEAYTATLPGRRRHLLPVYSMMIGSEPLTPAQCDAIGLHDRPTFTDGRHLIVYGQRTADGRIAFGGRGAPYHFGSRVDADFDTDPRVRRHLIEAVRQLFPILGQVDFPHHWGGPLGVPRDWHPSVRFDRTSRLATAGGYAGDGVAAAHLAGRTLAELITGNESERTSLPWVHHHSPLWETEPWRWLGVNATRLAAGRADHAESRRGRRGGAMWRGVLSRLSGR